MKYTFSTPGGGEPKIVLQSRPGESDRHIALKILAYLLFHNDAGGLPLQIEQGVGQRHKPDLVAADPETGRVVLWIDCGQIEGKRLGRIAAANSHARVIVVKATATEARNYAPVAARHLPAPARPRRADVVCLGFDEEFFDWFRLALRGTNDVSLERDDETQTRVMLNGEIGGTRLHYFAARPRRAP